MYYTKKKSGKSLPGNYTDLSNNVLSSISNSTLLNNSSLPIQCKVGLEFQTFAGNWNIYHSTGAYISANAIDLSSADKNPAKDENHTVLAVKVPEHAEPLVKANGYKIETDGSDLEYITDAFDDQSPDDRTAIAAACKNAGNAHRSLDWAGAQSVTLQNVAIFDGDDRKHILNMLSCFAYNSAGGQYLINPDGQKNAHPQATAGLKLEQIMSFMNDLVDPSVIDTYGHTTFDSNMSLTLPGRLRQIPPDSYAKNQYQALKSSLDTTRNEDSGDISLSPAKGLISLFRQCIEVYKDASSTSPLHKDYSPRDKTSYERNAKNRMPFMPRTSFAAVFQILDAPNQMAVMEFLQQYPGETVVMGQERNGEKNLVTVSEYLSTFGAIMAYPGRYAEYQSQYNEAMNSANSMEALFLPVPEKPKDPALEKPFSAVCEIDSADAGSAVSARYGISRPTDISHDHASGAKVEGMIMELRALPNELPPEKWETLGKFIIELVHYHNDPSPSYAKPTFRLKTPAAKVPTMFNQKRRAILKPNVPKPPARRLFNPQNRRYH